MKRGAFVIFDREEDYARALLMQMKKKHFPAAECVVITKDVLLEEFLADNVVELLIAAEDNEEFLNRPNVRHVILLSEGRHVRESSNYPAVYKYQSMELVMQEIVSCYSSFGGDETAFSYASGEDKKVISVYSPSSGMARTMFAITMAREYAKKRETLYMPFEAFPVENPLDGRGGLSDLVYFLREKAQQIGIRIQTMAHKDGNLSYLAPVSHYKDVHELSAPEYLLLVRELRENSPYQVIVLEFGYFNEHVMQAMAVSDQIFIPYEEVMNQGIAYAGSGEAGRIHAFRKMLVEEGMEKLLEKLQVVPIIMEKMDWAACKTKLAREYTEGMTEGE